MKIRIATQLWWKAIISLLLMFTGQYVWASSGGITGFSGNPSTGSSTCTACHSGGVAPTVDLTGPLSVSAGSVNSYTLTMSGGQENLAGFDVSVSAGSLSATGSGIGVEGGELKHTQPFSVATAGGEWIFNFEAPATPGTVTIYAAVLSANGDKNMSGDNVGTKMLTVEVTAAQQKLNPKAQFIGHPYFAQPGATVQMDGGASTDGDGTITWYTWDFGDGSEIARSAIATQSHVYANEGVYTVTLAVTDNDGRTGAAATSVTVTADAGSAQGEALYNQKCNACHGPGGTGASASNITGKTADQILNAVANIGAMQSISLTTEEAQLIEAYLASGGGGEPPPRPTDGPGLYGMFCAACHGADGRGGSAIGVTGASYPMIDAAIQNIGAMQSIDLSLEEKQKVAQFLSAGGSDPIPTDSKGIYAVFCSVCHGDGGHGGKFKAVTGASHQMISEAINQEVWMQSLVLSQTQIESVAAYLGAGGEPPLPTSERGLYGVFCAVCHGDDAHGGKFKAVTGASQQMISEAIVDVPWMQGLQINATQNQAIAKFLGAGGEPPLPSDGKGLYGVFCAVCHGAGGHGGKFIAVTGAADQMISEAIATEPWMNALQLSSTQRQQIAAYLGGGGEPPLPTTGAGLYDVYCSVCHGVGGRGGTFKAVTGAPATMISNAINSEPWMTQLALTQTQINLIAGYLTAGGGGTVPTDGAGIYQIYCSVCHGADGRGGSYKVVTGSSTSFVNSALNNVSLMRSLQLSSSQVQAVAGFLASGGSGAKPTDGAGLYHVYCETCHGPNGSGGPEENVRGASASSISQALSGVSAMRHLQPYVTTSGSPSDTSLISNFLNGR